MTRMRLINRILMAVAVAAATASCGDVVRTGRAPVLLVIDSLLGASAPSTTFTSNIASDVITLVTTGGVCTTVNPCPTYFSDPGQVTLRIVPKDIGTPSAPTTPSTNNDVTITRVHVQYRRTDRQNAVQGVDVPFAFDGATTGTVSATGAAQLGFVLVRNDAKIESPLIQLRSSGVIISTIADVTFYGKDLVGNDISVTGSIQVDFGNFGDK
jgi:hypothetical protein